MAAVKQKKFNANRRVSPLKPNLRGARNMMAAKYRQANYSKAAAMRFWSGIAITVFGTIFLALWLGGVLPDVRQAGENMKRDRLMAMGFVVKRIDVMGEGRLREDDVRQALGVNEGEYLFAPDLKAAKARVESLSWVDDALVRRLWPNRIVVQIIERRPYALWQKDGIVHVVDADGALINDADPMDFTDLPLIVGQGAQTQAASLDGLMSRFPDIAGRVDAAVYVSESRWNLVLSGHKMTVKLPADNPAAALSKLRALQSRTQILDREIEVIDLRLTDRITLSPSPSDRA
ncbi:cell division protein FtsQ/DivIB [Fretibacter rubidus]|uniref:cell division protein FtsQ/DivIB n=1 Tax=Fretibacter rubidus TaxID=570162 RepID=UPI00352B10FD